MRLRTTVAVASAVSACALLALLLGLPLVALLVRGGESGIRALATDSELLSALGLTALTATGATVATMLLGTPLAWLLARDRLPGGAIVSALVELPLMIPHPVAGIALLLAFGRTTLPGQLLAHAGLSIVGSGWGIALAMLFVSSPLYVSGAREAIARVDRRYEDVARTLGDSHFTAIRRITIPLAGRGLIASAVIMWARAISEFGAIVILTYNPKVASVLSYDRFTGYGIDSAIPVAAALLLLAFVPLMALRVLRVRASIEQAM